jgi:hypothetical protein
MAVEAGGLAMKAEFDPVSGRFTVEMPPGIISASIHRGEPGVDGPVLHRLIDPASRSPRVTITLPPYQRPMLREGALRLTVQTSTGRTTHPLIVRPR